MSKTNRPCKLKSLPGLKAFLFLINAATAYAQATAFIYQGRLVADGSPASSLYDFEFKLFDTADLGSTTAVGVGEYYRDNAIVAWAKVTASGVTSDNGFGIAGITHTATGIYTITLIASAADNTFLIPVALAENDVAPTSAATLRIVSVNQSSTNSFQVFINNGTGTLVDNEFVFIVTAR